MKLFTKEILNRIPRLYGQDHIPAQDQIVHVKLFNPTGSGTWLITEYDPNDNTAFGMCYIHEAELGYVDIDELEEFRGHFGLGIERDIHFKPCKMIDACRKEGIDYRF